MVMLTASRPPFWLRHMAPYEGRQATLSLACLSLYWLRESRACHYILGFVNDWNDLLHFLKRL